MGNKRLQKKLKYAVQQRLRMIDLLLFEYGHINRTAIMDIFGISPAAATRDFKDYRDIAPDNMTYNINERAYYKTQKFKRVWE